MVDNMFKLYALSICNYKYMLYMFKILNMYQHMVFATHANGSGYKCRGIFQLTLQKAYM